MISAHIASLPERELCLQNTLSTIVHQVDKVYVMLNGYTSIPEFLKSHVYAGKNVTINLLDNSLGANAKLLHCWDEPSICVVCDDDLIYPNGYVSFMMKGLQRHGGVVSLHGKSFANRPVVHYRRNFTSNHRCLGSVSQDVKVDVIGSGCMMFDNQQVKLDSSIYEYRNMTDVLFSRLCTLQGVPMTVLSHNAGYLRYMPQEKTVWNTEKDDTNSTRILNSFLK